MRRALLFLMSFIVAIFILAPIYAQGQTPIFPGAEGFGIYTPGGRGGGVYKVTTLADDGEGSLRWALEDNNNFGPRTVIFEVSGYIDLDFPIAITKPYLSVFGQTAPAPGVSLRHDYVQICTHDVVIQHLRFRPGVDHEEGPPHYSEDEDAHSLGFKLNPRYKDVYYDPVENVVIDHCTISWMPSHITLLRPGSSMGDITFSNCIISESLDRSIVEKGSHSMAILHGPNIPNVAYIKNLLAHNRARNPLIQEGSSAAIINNVIHNYINSPVVSGDNELDPIFLSMKGNHLIEGETSINLTQYALIVDDAAVNSRIYIQDNICPNCVGDWQDHVLFLDDLNLKNKILKTNPPLWPDEITVLDSEDVLDEVLDHVGAFPDNRDDIDTRIVSEVQAAAGGNVTGKFVDCVTDDMLSIQWGDVYEAGSDSIVLANDGTLSTESTAYEGYKIRIISGTGEGQVRMIRVANSSGDGYDPVTRTCYVETPWDTEPNNTSDYLIFQDCANNAGGWTTLADCNRELELPDSYNTEMPSGYTRLEEWIHTFPKDNLVISGFEAYTDSGDAGEYFKFQYRLRAIWQTDLPATTRLQYRVLGDTEWSATPIDESLKTDHYVEVKELPPGTTFECRALSKETSAGTTCETIGPIGSTTTEPAVVNVSNYAFSQLVDYVERRPEITFSFDTNVESSCKINIKKKTDSDWGSTPEVEVSAFHGTSHTHVVTSINPSGDNLEFETEYEAYIQVFSESLFGGEDTVFPDGCSMAQAAIYYIEFETQNHRGEGGSGGLPNLQQLPPGEQTAEYRLLLSQNYPNPFNPTTSISFNLPERAVANLSVYSVDGTLVKTLANGVLDVGIKEVTWDGTDARGNRVSSGVYFYRLKAGQNVLTKKMVLLK